MERKVSEVYGAPCIKPNCNHLASKTVGGGLYVGCRLLKIDFGHVSILESSEKHVKKCKHKERVKV